MVRMTLPDAERSGVEVIGHFRRTHLVSDRLRNGLVGFSGRGLEATGQRESGRRQRRRGQCAFLPHHDAFPAGPGVLVVGRRCFVCPSPTLFSFTRKKIWHHIFLENKKRKQRRSREPFATPLCPEAVFLEAFFSIKILGSVGRNE